MYKKEGFGDTTGLGGRTYPKALLQLNSLFTRKQASSVGSTLARLNLAKLSKASLFPCAYDSVPVAPCQGHCAGAAKDIIAS